MKAPKPAALMMPPVAITGAAASTMIWPHSCLPAPHLEPWM